jgi:hypothetical protein
MVGNFIYPHTKTYYSVKHLHVLSFFIFSLISTYLVDHHVWQPCVNKTWHVTSRHWSSVATWPWRLKFMTCGLDALMQRGGLAMMTQIVGSHFAKIIDSHLSTNSHRHAAVVDQWICTYMDCFVDTWLPHVMINRTSGYKWGSEKT